jgi:hypothetical protein
MHGRGSDIFKRIFARKLGRPKESFFDRRARRHTSNRAPPFERAMGGRDVAPPCPPTQIPRTYRRLPRRPPSSNTRNHCSKSKHWPSAAVANKLTQQRTARARQSTVGGGTSGAGRKGGTRAPAGGGDAEPPPWLPLCMNPFCVLRRRKTRTNRPRRVVRRAPYCAPRPWRICFSASLGCGKVEPQPTDRWTDRPTPTPPRRYHADNQHPRAPGELQDSAGSHPFRRVLDID